jgi:MFS family permease
MSVGSWLLAAYSAPTAVAALSAATGRAPRTGAAATAGAAVLAPGIASYTAAILAGTAVPAWHDAHRELPFLFVGSGSVAAGGLALLSADAREAVPARRLATAGWVLDVVALERLRRRLGPVAEPYDEGRPAAYLRAAKVLGVAGVVGAQVGRRHRGVRAAAGTALAASSLCTRFGVFHAGLASARDPRFVVGPQRQRVEQTTTAGT